MAITKNVLESGRERPSSVTCRSAMGFEQSALRGGSGAIEFIGQENIGEDRPRSKLEFTALLIKHIETGHIGRQQIRRAYEYARIELRMTEPQPWPKLFCQYLAYHPAASVLEPKASQDQFDLVTLANQHFV